MKRLIKRARRGFLKASAALGAAGIAASHGLDSTAGSATASLTELSATEATSAMRRGEISAETYASALLDRAVALDSLNAFVSLDRDKALEAARAADQSRAAGKAPGVLHGLPIPVKDSINTKGLPTTSGTRALVTSDRKMTRWC